MLRKRLNWGDNVGGQIIISLELWVLVETISSSNGVTHSAAEGISHIAEAVFIDVSVNPFVEGALTRVTGIRLSS